MPWRFDRETDTIEQAGVAEKTRIPRGIHAPRLRPGGKMRGLHPKHRGLERVHSKVCAHRMVVVLRFHAVRAQKASPRREIRILCRQQPCITKGAEVLAWKKRETPQSPDASGWTRVVGR